MIVEPTDDAAVEVETRVGAVDAVVAVGIDELHEGLVGLYEGLGELGGVAEVDVVVGRAMADEEVTVELRSTGDGVAVVARGVLLRGAHETLSIDAVVVAIAGDGRHGDTGGEDATALGHGHQGHETAIRPAPDGDAVLVDVGLLVEIEGSLHLVAGLEEAEVLVSLFLELSAAPARAAAVDADADVALLSQVVLEEAATHIAG